MGTGSVVRLRSVAWGEVDSRGSVEEVSVVVDGWGANRGMDEGEDSCEAHDLDTCEAHDFHGI